MRKLSVLLGALLFSASPAVAENVLEGNPVSLIKIDQRLAQSHSSEIVFVLLYNPGTDQEGIHTIDNRTAAGEIEVLLFESEADALIYSSKLEEMNFPVPTVTALHRHEAEQLTIYNYKLLFVESGKGVDAPIGETNNPEAYNY